MNVKERIILSLLGFLLSAIAGFPLGGLELFLAYSIGCLICIWIIDPIFDRWRR